MVKVYEVGEVYFDGKTPVPSYEEYKQFADASKKVKAMSQKIERLELDNDVLEDIVKEKTKSEGEYIKEVLNLKKKLEIALTALGQVAKFSKDDVDAVQCANAIVEIEEVK